jgi:hypothetical protein
MKNLLLLLLLSNGLVYFSYSNPIKNEGAGNDYLNSIEEKIYEIENRYNKYYLEQFREDIKICQNAILDLKKNPISDSLKQIKYDLLMQTFDKIEYADFIIESIETEKERYTNRYFKTWDKMFHLKLRVDKLYTKISVNENLALNQKSEFLTYRKKYLHEAYVNVYEYNFSKLKNLNECDYKNKIDVINSTISLLEVSEKLLFANDTKELEKSLKKITDTNEIKKLLSTHSLAKDIIWY